MANHSLIRLKTAVEPEDVEKALDEINQRRFGGRLRRPEATLNWMAGAPRRGWFITAPDTRPKEPSAFKPDEDLGFLTWLHGDGKHIETRHGVHNQWMRWIMYIHEHELAKHFGIDKFNGGDGMVPTRPNHFQKTFYDYAVYNYAKPLSEKDKVFIQKYFLDEVPEKWR